VTASIAASSEIGATRRDFERQTAMLVVAPGEGEPGLAAARTPRDRVAGEAE
jgi:hypothetical protein